MAKVLVAMSGGVDSAVTALLLQQAGYEVHGVFMKNYEPPPGSNQPCPWEADQADVQRTCEHLGMPWAAWNFEQDYTRHVLEYFFREYQAGRTPNPDVRCNREIKFGVFLRRALAEGYETIATGHYARNTLHGKTYQLRAGVDPTKDQSYFLHQLGQRELKHILFPLGTYKKTDVRRLAAEAGIPVAKKPDSQGICFIGKVNVADFLREHLPIRPGAVVTEDGERIGEHQGLSFYTIGQRHGLGVGGGVPYYVARKDPKTNTLVVAKGNRDNVLYAKHLTARDVSWVAGQTPGKEFSCSAQIRYRQQRQTCVVKTSPAGVTVDFTLPQRAVTAGQAVVFYQDDVCLGGGTILEQG